MDKKQTLRQLHQRLATRLEAVRAGDVNSAAAWLAVQIGASGYLLPLTQSGEIFPVSSLQSVAHTANWYAGVTSLRGTLWGVVNMAYFLDAVAFPMSSGTGNSNRPESAGISARNHTFSNTLDVTRQSAKLVTLHPVLDLNCALQVQHVHGLRSTDDFQDSCPPLPSLPRFFSHVYTDVLGVKWQELNLQHLSTHAAFLDIASAG